MKWQSIRIFLTLLAIGIISIGMLSCGSDDEGPTDRNQTTDPSEPIVVATDEPIDFEAEKTEIQQVYSAFYSAFNGRKISDIRKIWKDHPVHAQFGAAWEVAGAVEPVEAIGWPQIESTIENLWIAQGTKGHNWNGSNRFSQFWIRRTKTDPNSLEASARASARYRNNQGPGVTYAYLIKNEHENWQLQQIQSVTQTVVNMRRGDVVISKYFTDKSAKAP